MLHLQELESGQVIDPAAEAAAAANSAASESSRPGGRGPPARAAARRRAESSSSSDGGDDDSDGPPSPPPPGEDDPGFSYARAGGAGDSPSVAALGALCARAECVLTCSVWGRTCTRTCSRAHLRA